MRWRGLRLRSLRQQIVLLTAAATALAVVLLTVLLQLLLSRLTASDADKVVDSRANTVVASISVKSGQIHVPRARLVAGVAVYEPGGLLVEGAPPVNLADDYDRLRQTTQVRKVTPNDATRIEARPFRRLGVSGVVIVSEPLAPYHEAEHLALVVSIVAGLGTVTAASAVAWWATRRALRPVEVMARAAASWSEHDLGRRFAGSGTRVRDDELGELAATLDGLLDRVSAAIRSEQRLTAELAHELRTPLTSVRGEADLALMRDELEPSTRDALTAIVAATQRMSQTISTLLDLARNEAGVVAAARSSLRAVVAEVVADVRGAAADSAIALAVDVPDVRLAVPHQLAVRALVPVLENALRFARSTVLLSGRVRGGFVELIVTDDGLGVDAARVESVFEPGVTSGGSAGLGLAISRRVARSSGGDVTVDPDSGPGASRFVLRLPTG